MTISERIFELLKERGYTQKEFSKKTGIAESTISDWKKKGTNPVSDKILVICDVLEVSPYYLLSGVEREDRKTVKAPVRKEEPEKQEAKKEALAEKPVKKEAPKKETPKKEAPKKDKAEKGIILPEISTIARDDEDYRIGKADEEKSGKKDKKKDKKDKVKEAGGKDKKKKKEKKKDKKKKGYLIVS